MTGEYFFLYYLQMYKPNQLHMLIPKYEYNTKHIWKSDANNINANTIPIKTENIILM